MSETVGFGLVALIAAWGMNAGMVWLFDYPWLYCIRGSILPPFVQEFWRMGAFLFTVVGIGYAALTVRWLLLFQIICVVFLIYGLPHYFEVLFNIGGNCGK